MRAEVIGTGVSLRIGVEMSAPVMKFADGRVLRERPNCDGSICEVVREGEWLPWKYQYAQDGEGRGSYEIAKNSGDRCRLVVDGLVEREWVPG